MYVIFIKFQIYQNNEISLKKTLRNSRIYNKESNRT